MNSVRGDDCDCGGGVPEGDREFVTSSLRFPSRESVLRLEGELASRISGFVLPSRECVLSILVTVGSFLASEPADDVPED